MLLTIGLVVLGAKFHRLSSRLALLQGSDGKDDFVSLATKQLEVTTQLDEHVRMLDEKTRYLREGLAHSVRHVAVVRYDAYGDNYGNLSFSACFLDDFASGLVLTCINGRSEARVFAKAVIEAKAIDVEISVEEEEAIRMAMNQQPSASGSRQTGKEQVRA